MALQNAVTAVRTDERTSAIVAASFAIVVGLFLVFATGFAHPQVVHNAAHDARHAMSFPCH